MPELGALPRPLLWQLGYLGTRERSLALRAHSGVAGRSRPPPALPIKRRRLLKVP